MTEIYQLFGKRISPQARLSLVEQTHDILCEEIQAGRWRVGERLPSINALAEESGLSRWPIQRAFEMLQNEGYIHAEGGKRGTFLDAVLPKGREPVGVIGVAMQEEDESSLVRISFNQVRLNRILRLAAERQLKVEVVALRDNDEEWLNVNTPQGPFGPAVQGVLSLRNIRRIETRDFSPGERLPLVVVGVSGEFTVAPCVTADIHRAYAMLTQRLVEEGHERIALCGYGPLEGIPYRQAWKSHSRVMEKASLATDEEFFHRSLQSGQSDYVALRDLLESAPETTAFVAMSPWRAEALIQVAQMSGRRVPQDLSVVCYGGPITPSPEEGAVAITRVASDMNEICDIALDLLLGRVVSRHEALTEIYVRPHWVEGQTVASPADASQEKASASAQAPERL